MDVERDAKRAEEALRARGGVGVFGGAFDPVHRGHLHAAAQVQKRLGLSRVIFVPAAISPLKEAQAPAAPGRLRLAWLRRATEGEPAFEVDALEIEQGGISYTVDTMRILQGRLKERPVFLIGEDAFAGLAEWRRPGELLALCHVLVMRRPGAAALPAGRWLPIPPAGGFAYQADGEAAWNAKTRTWIRRIDVAGLDISSTCVRRRLREGLPVEDLLPPGVAAQAQQSGCYDPCRAGKPA